MLRHACIGRRFPSGNLCASAFLADEQPLRIAVAGPLVLDDDTPMILAARDGAGRSTSMKRWCVAISRRPGGWPSWKRGACHPAVLFLTTPARHYLPPALRAFVEFIQQ